MVLASNDNTKFFIERCKKVKWKKEQKHYNQLGQFQIGHLAYNTDEGLTKKKDQDSSN